MQVSHDGADAVVVARATREEDRFFPPMLAAEILLDVRGLVHQRCFSRFDPLEGSRAKAGSSKGPRRWAFAQEIYSNQGRGTESGHFLEHLALEMALGLRPRARGRLSAETSWNFRDEPDVFRIRFYNVEESVVNASLVQCASVLTRHGFPLDLGPLRELAEAGTIPPPARTG